VNISLVNELALLAQPLGVDIWEVIRAAASKPFGFMPFYPGPGAGGHCIPVDPHYLRWKMRQYHLNTRFIELATEINNRMPHVVVERVMDALNDDAQALKGAKIAALGVAYKPNIADPRESPAIEVVELLLKKGAVLEYHDPHIPHLRVQGHELHSVPFSEAWLQRADCVVILTHHQGIDWAQVVQHSRLVVDTRHVTTAQAGGARIVRL
jgi:UDP-N-acetyl-D-glucosamine dehydrogenase